MCTSPIKQQQQTKQNQTKLTFQNRSELRNNNNKKQHGIMMKYPWKKLPYQAYPAANQSVITKVHWMTLEDTRSSV